MNTKTPMKQTTRTATILPLMTSLATHATTSRQIAATATTGIPVETGMIGTARTSTLMRTNLTKPSPMSITTRLTAMSMKRMNRPMTSQTTMHPTRTATTEL